MTIWYKIAQFFWALQVNYILSFCMSLLWKEFNEQFLCPLIWVLAAPCCVLLQLQHLVLHFLSWDITLERAGYYTPGQISILSTETHILIDIMLVTQRFFPLLLLKIVISPSNLLYLLYVRVIINCKHGYNIFSLWIWIVTMLDIIHQAVKHTF